MFGKKLFFLLIIVANFIVLHRIVCGIKEDLMTKNSIKLLVTTSQSLLLVDTENGKYVPIHRGNGIYYGISFAENKLYVAAHNRQRDSNLKFEMERGEILVFDNSGKLYDKIQPPFPLRRMHQIAYHEGKLYVTCTFDNMIAIYNGSVWEQWFPLGGSFGQGDKNHFNSFFFKDNCLWILANNCGPSELLAFSLANKELIEKISLGRGAHNIWYEDGQFFTCSSEQSKIIGNKGFELNIYGFIRGVAFSDNFRFIGTSEKVGDRSARDYTSGRLLIFDRDWSYQKEIILEGEGQVRDIYVLPSGFKPEI